MPPKVEITESFRQAMAAKNVERRVQAGQAASSPAAIIQTAMSQAYFLTKAPKQKATPQLHNESMTANGAHSAHRLQGSAQRRNRSTRLFVPTPTPLTPPATDGWRISSLQMRCATKRRSSAAAQETVEWPWRHGTEDWSCDGRGRSVRKAGSPTCVRATSADASDQSDHMLTPRQIPSMLSLSGPSGSHR